MIDNLHSSPQIVEGLKQRGSITSISWKRDDADVVFIIIRKRPKCCATTY